MRPKKQYNTRRRGKGKRCNQTKRNRRTSRKKGGSTSSPFLKRFRIPGTALTEGLSYHKTWTTYDEDQKIQVIFDYLNRSSRNLQKHTLDNFISNYYKLLKNMQNKVYHSISNNKDFGDLYIKAYNQVFKTYYTYNDLKKRGDENEFKTNHADFINASETLQKLNNSKAEIYGTNIVDMQAVKYFLATGEKVDDKMKSTIKDAVTFLQKILGTEVEYINNESN